MFEVETLTRRQEENFFFHKLILQEVMTHGLKPVTHSFNTRQQQQGHFLSASELRRRIPCHFLFLFDVIT